MMMTDIGLYVTSSLILSIGALLMALWYLWRVSRAYRRFHDERAAVSLVKALGLTVVAFGTVVSAIGLLAEHGPLSGAGLSIARGALVVTLATLVLTDVRPRGD